MSTALAAGELGKGNHDGTLSGILSALIEYGQG